MNETQILDTSRYHYNSPQQQPRGVSSGSFTPAAFEPALEARLDGLQLTCGSQDSYAVNNVGLVVAMNPSQSMICSL